MSTVQMVAASTVMVVAVAVGGIHSNATLVFSGSVSPYISLDGSQTENAAVGTGSSRSVRWRTGGCGSRFLP